MVAAIVVVMAASVVGSVALVPNICQGAHGLRLLFVDRLQEIRVNRSAVAAYSVVIQCQGIFQKAFVACHDVGQVSQGLRGVSLCSDVDVDSAASGVVALGTGFSQATDKLLQGFDVTVGQDRGDQFAFLAVGSGDADILLEFPFSAVCVPGAPGFVTVASCGVLVSACSKELCGKACCLLAGDVVHLDLDPNGLLLHFLNLSGKFIVHGVCLRFFFVFPFGVCIFPYHRLNSKSYRRHISTRDTHR